MYFTSNRCRDLGSLFSQAPRRRPIHFWGAAATPIPLSLPCSIDGGYGGSSRLWPRQKRRRTVVTSSRFQHNPKATVAAHFPNSQTGILRACVFTNSEKTVKLLFHGACFGGFTFSTHTFLLLLL